MRRTALLLAVVLIATACSGGGDSPFGAPSDLPDPDNDPAPTPETAAAEDPPDESARREVVEPLGPGEQAVSVTGDGVVRAETVPCPFATDSLGPVTCGEVSMPSRSAEPATDDVRLAYARFHGDETADDLEPLVYLHGGPGGEVVAYADYFIEDFGAVVRAGRDVIVYDQRGGGISSPLPPCHRVWQLQTDYFTGSIAHVDLTASYVAAVADCASAMDFNHDLATYNSETHAADLVDLLRALGIDRYDLHGVSYGSRLAQTVLRDHPEGVRSVVLSGVYPIEAQIIGSVPATFESALDTVFAACAATPTCHDRLPDPWGTLASVVVRLDADPVVVDLGGFPVAVTGDELVNIVFSALYRRSGAAEIPDLLIELERAETSRLAEVADLGVFDIGSVAAFVSVQCREEAPFTDDAAIARRLTGVDPVDRMGDPPALMGAALLEICASWDVGPAPAHENDPVTWEQPTLLFSGGFDPITPPWWAKSLAGRLPDATLVHHVDRGHDSAGGECSERIIADFLAAPEVPPAVDCVATAPSALLATD